MVVCQVVYMLMCKQKGGMIVNVMFLVVYGFGCWMGVDYVVLKVVFFSLMQSFVFEVVCFGICCNVFLFGFVEIDMIEGILEDNCKVLGIFLGCLGDLNEVVIVVCFLLLDVFLYMIGQVLYVDGGLWMNGQDFCDGKRNLVCCCYWNGYCFGDWL